MTLRFVSALGAMLVTSGCFAVRYVSQAAAGQAQLLTSGQSIRSALGDRQLSPSRRALLAELSGIKAYGKLHGLKATRNYERYVPLERDAAVYVVQGAGRLSVTPRRWEFPIVGSVPYLGWFQREAAERFATELEKTEDLDVTVRTASAYSTLGWFPDPVLSTMLEDGPNGYAELANVVLHESVHATVYVPGQSPFDESLASFVADRLTWDLLVARFGFPSAETRAWSAAQRRSEEVSAAFRQTHDALETLYASARPKEEQRAQKRRLLEKLSASLHTKRRFNNADLAGLRTYDAGADAFEVLFRRCASWPRFFEAIGTLRSSDFPSPHSTALTPVIEALAARSCAPKVEKP